jgi:hypothetical protein
MTFEELQALARSMGVPLREAASLLGEQSTYAAGIARAKAPTVRTPARTREAIIKEANEVLRELQHEKDPARREVLQSRSEQLAREFDSAPQKG